MSATRPRRPSAVPGAAVLLACALLSAAARNRPSSPEPDRDAAIKTLKVAIQTAFKRCDAASLDGAFSPRVKTFLASRALGVRQGYYGADQARLMLRRAFMGRSTLRFRLGTPDDPAPDGGRRLVVPARWVFRDESTSKADVRLSFTLAREGSVWIIREIRESK